MFIVPPPSQKNSLSPRGTSGERVGSGAAEISNLKRKIRESPLCHLPFRRSPHASLSQISNLDIPIHSTYAPLMKGRSLFVPWTPSPQHQASLRSKLGINSQFVGYYLLSRNVFLVNK